MPAVWRVANWKARRAANPSPWRPLATCMVPTATTTTRRPRPPRLGRSRVRRAKSEAPRAEPAAEEKPKKASRTKEPEAEEKPKARPKQDAEAHRPEGGPAGAEPTKGAVKKSAASKK